MDTSLYSSYVSLVVLSSSHSLPNPAEYGRLIFCEGCVWVDSWVHCFICIRCLNWLIKALRGHHTQKSWVRSSGICYFQILRSTMLFSGLCAQLLKHWRSGYWFYCLCCFLTMFSSLIWASSLCSSCLAETIY